MQPGTMRRTSALACAALFSLSTNAWSQTTSASEDATRAHTDKELSGAGDRSLGDMVDLNTGSLSFSQTDVSIPGNSTLQVAITRRFDAQRMRSLSVPASSLAFYDWQIDVPRISVTLATSNPWPANRCSSRWVPPVLNPAPDYYFSADQYSGGFKIEFPGGSAQMLLPSGNVFPKPSSFVWVAAGNIGVSCTTATNPDGTSAGEGFTVWLPDGSRYDLTLHTVATALSIRNPPDGDVGKAGPIIYRQVEMLLATRATDRFGNTVTYTYDTAGKLTQIASSDSRTLNIYWTTYNSSPVIDHVSDGSRTWAYGYANNELATVTRPDGSQWHFSLAAIAALKPGATNPAPLGYTGSMISPYGLTGTFTMEFVDNPWANVRPLGVPTSFQTVSVMNKQLSGPGIPQQTWTYNYLFDLGSYANDGTNRPETKVTEVVDPTGVKTRSTYNINYDWREGQLEKKEIFPSGSSTAAQTMLYSYVQTPQIGTSPLEGGNYFNRLREGDARRMSSMDLYVNGDHFVTQISSVDAYRNPTATAVSNSFSNTTLNMTKTYQNTNASYSPWVIGAMTSMSVNGVTASQSTLNSQLQPQDMFMFGLRKSTTIYSSNGLPQSMADGLNHTTSLSNFYRGKPQTMTRQDGKVVTMVVNSTGTVASMTDARGNTTSMGYDALMRPTSITYPANDTVNWASSATAYSTLTAAELGVPAGAFRARTTLARMQKTTYYDAMLRPVLVEMLDLGGSSSPIYMRKTYDALGRITFMSYPASTPDAPSGVSMVYDALDRMLSETTTDNVLLKTVSYQSGNQMWTTDASGNTTKTAFQAFGMPAYKDALQIVAPGGATTSMVRDIFGNLQSATQGGITQTWIYDGNYQLCKKVEPETGQTVYKLDADGKMMWSVGGFAGNASACENGSKPSNAVEYTYRVNGDPAGVDDGLDRLTRVHYADSSGDVTMTYDLDGHVLTANNATAQWTYRYNKRGLLEAEQAVVDGKTFNIQKTYDTQASLKSTVYPDGMSVPYSPDGLGRATQIGSFATSIQYHPSGKPNGYTLGNGLTAATIFNARQVPETMRVLQGGTVLQSLTYSYNDDLDITRIVDGVDGTDSAMLGYDAQHRLTSASGVWGMFGYTYDANNNITVRTNATGDWAYHYDSGTNHLSSVTTPATSQSTPPPPSQPPSPLDPVCNSISGPVGCSGIQLPQNPLPAPPPPPAGPPVPYALQYVCQGKLAQTCGSIPAPPSPPPLQFSLASILADTGGTKYIRSYSYDTRGRVLADGTYNYTWNDADQLVSVSGVATYGYDAKGKRIRSVNQASGEVEYALYDSSGTLVFTQKGSVNTDFLQLDGKPLAQVANSTTTFLHVDLLGSPRMATNQNQQVQWREHFDPFGVKLNNVGGKIGYTGHAFDQETNLTYAQARFYDAAVGRFISTDKVEFDASDTFAFNRYAYANDNPYKFTDPTGNCVQCAAVAFGTVVGGLVGATVEVVKQVGTNLSNGQSLGSSLSNINGTKVAIEAAKGAITGLGASLGAVGAEAVGAGKIATYVAEAAGAGPLSISASAATNYVTTGSVGDPTSNFAEGAGAAIGAMLGGPAGSAVGSKMGSELGASAGASATRGITKEAVSAGASEATKAVLAPSSISPGSQKKSVPGVPIDQTPLPPR